MDKDQEYWKVEISPEDEKDLDLELFEEINEEFSQEEPIKKVKSKRGRKIVALVTVAIFGFFVINSFLQVFNMPSLAFLKESSQLRENPEIKNLMEAVVKIKTSQSSGTGFNIAEEGLIITNYHVVSGSKNLIVEFSSNWVFNSTQLLGMPEIDLAILNIEGEGLPTLKLASDASLDIGEEVLIIGNPLGLSKIVKKGEILGKTAVKGIDEEVIMIRGPIHQGSSGSPVFNQEGEVIAVIFATLIQKDAKQDDIIGVAIPIGHIKKQIEALKEL